MTDFKRGQKSKLADLTPGTDLYVGVAISGPGLSFDISCFGLDGQGQLADDRYFVFFNQTASPEGSIQLLGEQAGDAQSFRVDLGKVPPAIDKLVFVATLDGDGTMAQVSSGALRLAAGGQDVVRFPFSGADFGGERAIMVAELYRKDVWRFAAVGQGFAGGLDAVLQSFGGEVAEEEPAAAAPAAAPGFAPPPPAAAAPAFAPPSPSAAAPAPSPAQSPASAPTATPATSAPVQPGVRVSLDKFSERPAEGKRWMLQNSKLLKVTLGAEVLARQGSMVAYQGNVEFDYEGAGGASRWLKNKMSGQGMSLMRCSGQGEVFIAEDATDLHIIELEGQGITVNAANVLAFDADLQTDITRLDGAGLASGSLFAVVLSGNGTVVVMTKGTPVVLQCDQPTFADTQAAVAWTSGMRVSVTSQVRMTRALFSGGSGEMFQLAFQGMPGQFVIVQPHEG